MGKQAKEKNSLIKKQKLYRIKKYVQKRENALLRFEPTRCYQPPAHEVSSLTTGLIALLNLLYLIHSSARYTV